MRVMMRVVTPAVKKKALPFSRLLLGLSCDRHRSVAGLRRRLEACTRSPARCTRSPEGHAPCGPSGGIGVIYIFNEEDGHGICAGVVW